MNKVRKLRIEKRKRLAQWSLAVRTRDDHSCIVCGVKAGDTKENGRKVVLNAHHIVSKAGYYKDLQYNLDNGITVCCLHHKFDTKCSAHKQPFIFLELLQKRIPEQLERLRNLIK